MKRKPTPKPPEPKTRSTIILGWSERGNPQLQRVPVGKTPRKPRN